MKIGSNHGYMKYSQAAFLFVIFKQKEPNKTIILNDEIEETEFVLDKVFFWTMPQEDLNDAEIYWNNIREKVLNNQIDLKNIFQSS